MTASLLYCVGAMAVIGSIRDGTGDPTLLYLKATLDGLGSVALASTFGIGVGLSVIPLAIYQGGIALASSSSSPNVSRNGKRPKCHSRVRGERQDKGFFLLLSPPCLSKSLKRHLGRFALLAHTSPSNGWPNGAKRTPSWFAPGVGSNAAAYRHKKSHPLHNHTRHAQQPHTHTRTPMPQSRAPPQ